jgi:hypothetical protein
MDIKPTGARKPQFDYPAQSTERTDVRFKGPAPQTADPAAAASPAGVPAGVTLADLRDAAKGDAAKVDQILMQCFGDLVDSADRQLGAGFTAAQRRDLLEFLGNDPVMSVKLLKYLEQVVK